MVRASSHIYLFLTSCFSAGISAATGRPFAPPSSFQMVARPNAAKKERSQILQGKCQKCRKWVPVEGIKDVESKVRFRVWLITVLGFFFGNNRHDRSRSLSGETSGTCPCL